MTLVDGEPLEYPDDWIHDFTLLPPDQGGPDDELAAPPTPEEHSPLYGGGTGESHETYLRRINPVPMFDTCLSFDDPTHTYSYEPVDGYFDRRRKVNSSTTAVVHQYFEDFDADGALRRMRMRGRMNDPTDRYYGMTDRQIKHQWARDAERASGIGTQMHNCIERYLNNARRPNDPYERTRQFALFRRWHARHMIEEREPPFRTELCMFHERSETAGMADLISQPLEWRRDPERAHWVNLKDWKCTQKCNWEYAPYIECEGEKARFEQDPRRIFWSDTHKQVCVDHRSGKTYTARRAKGVFDCLVDCTLALYTVQLNWYWFMATCGSALEIKSAQIVAFYWGNDEPVVFNVPNLQPQVARAFYHRHETMLIRYELEAEQLLLRENPDDDEQLELLSDRVYSLQHAPTERWPHRKPPAKLRVV